MQASGATIGSVEVHQACGQVCNRIWKIWPKAQSFAIFRAGFFEPVVVRQVVSEIVMGLRILGPRAYSLAILDDRRIHFADHR